MTTVTKTVDRVKQVLGTRLKPPVVFQIEDGDWPRFVLEPESLKCHRLGQQEGGVLAPVQQEGRFNPPPVQRATNRYPPPGQSTVPNVVHLKPRI